MKPRQPRPPREPPPPGLHGLQWKSVGKRAAPKAPTPAPNLTRRPPPLLPPPPRRQRTDACTDAGTDTGAIAGTIAAGTDASTDVVSAIAMPAIPAGWLPPIALPNGPLENGATAAGVDNGSTTGTMNLMDLMDTTALPNGPLDTGSTTALPNGPNGPLDNGSTTGTMNAGTTPAPTLPTGTDGTHNWLLPPPKPTMRCGTLMPIPLPNGTLH